MKFAGFCGSIFVGATRMVGGWRAPSKGYSVSWVEIPFGKSLANSPIASLGYLVATLWY